MITNKIKKLGLLVTLFSMSVTSGAFASTSGAASTDSILAPINNLKVLVIAIVGLAGVIILVKEIMEFSSAYKAADGTGMQSALKGIIGAVLMIGISAVLTFLGIK